jgi:L-asparaginase II
MCRGFVREVGLVSPSVPDIPKGVWCTRQGIVESVHRVSVVVSTDSGRILARHGDVDWMTVYRSAAKPFQAIPLVEDGVVSRFGLLQEELALTAASHNGEPEHLAGVAGILKKIGVSQDALRLGPFPPLRPQTAEALYRAGYPVTPAHNNCSGQHAAMLGLALVHGWPLDSYLDPAHPLQERMLEEMIRFTGVPREEMVLVPDGCGMVAFGVPLRNMARSFAHFGTAARDEEGPAKILEAMAAHPFMVAGTGRICTALAQATEGRIIGKLGAEGVYGMTIPGEGIGIALKVQDGGIRGGDAAAVRVLDLMGALNPSEKEALEPFRNAPVQNTLGQIVGEISANFSLDS